MSSDEWIVILIFVILIFVLLSLNSIILYNWVERLDDNDVLELEVELENNHLREQNTKLKSDMETIKRLNVNIYLLADFLTDINTQGLEEERQRLVEERDKALEELNVLVLIRKYIIDDNIGTK